MATLQNFPADILQDVRWPLRCCSLSKKGCVVLNDLLCASSLLRAKKAADPKA